MIMVQFQQIVYQRFYISKGFILYMAIELVHVKRCINSFLFWLNAKAVHSVMYENLA